MSFKLRLSLPLRFIASISVVILLTSLPLAWFFIHHEITQLRNALADKCGFLARYLADNSEYGVVTLNKDFLSQQVFRTAKEEDVVFAVIYDKNNAVLAIADKSMPPITGISSLPAATIDRLQQAFNTPAATVKPVGDIFTSKQGEKIYDMVSPILFMRVGGKGDVIEFMDGSSAGDAKEIIGYARVGISLARTNRQIIEMKEQMVLLFAIIFLSGLAISVLLGIIIVRPIRQLEEGTRRIARGNLDYRVTINSHDEIGDLANSFNLMAQDLTNYVQDLNTEKERILQLKTDLEHKTVELEGTLVKMQNIQQELLRSEKFATMGRLAGSLAHELRNPLASLKNISYYLLMRLGPSLDDKSKQLLHMMSTDIGRANKIVTDLLDYTTTKTLNRTPTFIDELVRKILKNINLPSAITVVEDMEPAQFSPDPDRLAQAITNLITNARDAMLNGGTLTLRAKKTDTAVRLSIEDTGSGMSKEALDHIYEPLFSTKIKGLGLGLPIVKDIIDMHSGTINVISKEGKGTTVEIDLPL